MQDNRFGSTDRLRCIATALALITSGGLTQSVSAFPPPPPGDEIVLNGFARDFIGSQHPDFNAAAPDAGFGHYAGNVSQVLGVDGAPLQVHGVTDFNIDFGTLVPGVPYAARLTVLGAEITSGGTPMPVTLMTETDTQTFEPFGPFADPDLGNVNDANNPRYFIYSLNDIYSAGTPISVTARSWMPSGGGGSGDVGWQGFSNYTTSDTRDKQRAFQVTMPEAGTVTSITAWALRYAGVGAVRYALYTDIAGEPGNLIAETPIGSAPLSWGWVTLPLPPTPITAGTYWLAYTCDNDARFKHISDVSTPIPATSQWRGLTYSALTNGFISSWGASSIGFIRTNQIYFSYTTAGTFSRHMSAKSGDNSPYVLVLRNGDSVPSIPGFQDQTNLAVFVDPFVNVATQKIVLDDNQAIYLFELGTTNLSSSAADFQDLVIMVTLANDPGYFFTPGSQSSELVPIGYKVDAQWRDASFDNIAPHTYTPALGDFGGVSGITSSGGVTSPATYYEWFRDILGENMGADTSITLTDDGTGVYEFLTNTFYPIDGLLYGNEGGGRNDNFTYSLAATFTYDASAGQFLEFEGGDGAWIFIDGKLVIDLGGVRSNVRQYADIDRLGLLHGQDYEMRLFYANRNRSNEFKFRTNLFLTPGGLLGSPSGFND